MGKKTLVMGVIGADVHAVGNQILNYAFTQAGFREFDTSKAEKVVQAEAGPYFFVNFS